MVEHRQPDSTNAPDCPRCGYDLGGQVAAWTDACDMQGRCPECGMGFLWGDLLSESRRRLPWLYEHARHPLDIRAAMSTFAQALLPHRFWRRVGPFCEVRPGRLALWLAVVSGLIFGAVWLLSVAVWIPLGLLYYTPLGAIDLMLLAAINAGLAQFGQIWNGYALLPILTSGWFVSLMFAFISFTMALVAIAAPSFWKSTRSHYRHIARIAVYALAGPLALQTIHFLVTFWMVTSFQYGFDRVAMDWRWWAAASNDVKVNSLIEIATVGQLGAGLAMLVASWWFGLRRGLGMNRRSATGLAVMSLAVALFAAFVALYWIFHSVLGATALPLHAHV